MCIWELSSKKEAKKSLFYYYYYYFTTKFWPNSADLLTSTAIYFFFLFEIWFLYPSCPTSFQNLEIKVDFIWSFAWTLVCLFNRCQGVLFRPVCMTCTACLSYIFYMTDLQRLHGNSLKTHTHMQERSAGYEHKQVAAGIVCSFSSFTWEKPNPSHISALAESNSSGFSVTLGM